jgi:hypothetical protein
LWPNLRTFGCIMRTVTHTRALVSLVAVGTVMVIVPACSSGSPSRSSPASPLAREYLTLAAPANRAWSDATKTLLNGTQGLIANLSDPKAAAQIHSSISAAVRADIAARNAFDAGLRALQLPPALSPLVSAVIQQDAAMDRSEEAVSSGDSSRADQAIQTGLEDRATLAGAVDALRAALGLLPPAQGSLY